MSDIENRMINRLTRWDLSKLFNRINTAALKFKKNPSAINRYQLDELIRYKDQCNVLLFCNPVWNIRRQTGTCIDHHIRYT